MKKIFIALLLCLFVCSVSYADRFRTATSFPGGVWIGPNTDDPTQVDGSGDLYVNGDAEIGGAIYSTGIVYSPKTFNIPLTSFFIDGTGIIGNDGTTAPGIAETDNVPAIVYASSAEQTKIQHTFRIPSDYQSGLGFRILLSSSNATSTGQSIDWQIWINDDDTTFDAAAVDQDAVSPTSATLDASNEVVTLNIDATGESAISAGSWLTIDIWNAGTSDNTTEIKGVQGFYQ